MKNTEFKIRTMSQNPIIWIFIIMAGLTLPLFLIPIITFTGYSEIVEEIAKALVILFLILKLPNYKMQILAGLSFGFLFGLSENFLYLNQIFQLGDFSVFWQRFLWTVPMHIMTVLVMVFAGLIGKKICPLQKFFGVGWIILGLAIAIVLHILFNSIVVNLLIR